MSHDITIGDQILTQFEVPEGEEKRRHTLSSLCLLLPDIGETSIKSALDGIRGMGGAEKRIRAVLYLTQIGNGGKPLPVFELGSEPDVPRTEENIVNQALEVMRRNRSIRHLQEERRMQRELADPY